MTTMTLFVEWIGPIWQPGVVAHHQEALKIGDGPFQTHFDDPRDADEIESWISTHSGDFSGITMWTGTLIEERSDASTVSTDTTRFWDRCTTTTKQVFAKDVKVLTDEEQIEWDDAITNIYSETMDDGL